MPRPKTPPSDVENAIYAEWVANPESTERVEALIYALRRHVRYLVGVILRQWSSDLTDEIVFHIYANLGKFDGTSKFSSWVHAVARNYCYDVRRINRARKEVPLEYAAEVAVDFDPDADIDFRGRVDSLPERERDVYDLLLAGHTHEEIATKLGLSKMTVRRTVGRLWNYGF